ncbi:MAG: OmpA family protein [Bacteroidota bacterium]
MKKIIQTFLLICLFSGNAIYAQQNIEKAERDYNNFAYIDALNIYERVAAKGHKSADLFQKIGNSYYFNGLLDKAEPWYEQLFDLTEEVEPEYYFRYAQSLQSVKKYVKADNIMEKFYLLTNDYRGKMYLEKKEYLNEIPADFYKYSVEDAGFNSEGSDYGVSFSENKMYFTSTRKSEKLKNRKDKWTNLNFTNLYSVTLDERENALFTDEIKEDLNSKYHESTPVFTKDGSTVYFTRNNYSDGKVKKSETDEVLLKIYKAKNVNNRWKEIEELPFVSDNYSVAHPALSDDEKTLYFASNMPGTYGESDLYSVSINTDGTYGSPKNLGPKINTKSRETFPYIAKDSTLYFATDGRPGFGGLDIFSSKMDKDGTFTEFENLSQPINSEKDDFAFIKSAIDSTGYFSSNRLGGKGFDDVYKYKILKGPETKIIEGSVVDDITGLPIEGAKVTLYDANHNLIKEIPVDEKGNYKVEVRKDREYYVKTEKPDYFTKEDRITKNSTDKSKTKLETKVKKVTSGDNLAEIFGMRIYFSFDKYDIRPDSETELAKIIEVMKQNPSMKIEIRSHTDSRQNSDYNMNLSRYRATSTRNYMIKKGIHPSRLTAKGFGETQLLNDCTEGTPCTVEEHQLNRRSEFIIMN